MSIFLSSCLICIAVGGESPLFLKQCKGVYSAAAIHSRPINQCYAAFLRKISRDFKKFVGFFSAALCFCQRKARRSPPEPHSIVKKMAISFPLLEKTGTAISCANHSKFGTKRTRRPLEGEECFVSKYST